MKSRTSNIMLLIRLFLAAFAFDVNAEEPEDETVFHILADTQEPMWMETLVLHENNNAEATDMVFDDIFHRSKTAVFHLGDIVALGFKDSEWEKADVFVNNLKSKDVKFFPVLGNHELFLSDSRGYKNFKKRYPFTSKTGYVRVVGNTAVVLLNSNFGEMSEKEIADQQKWYKAKMKDLEEDNSIDHIIVGTHYSPFTNSRISKPSEEVVKKFIPIYLKTNKAKLFVSGHAHVFEHFKYKGKDFLVIGGGGGIQQPTYKGSDRKFKNHYKKMQMFHYLECTSTPEQLKIDVRMIKKDFSGFKVVYGLVLK